MNFPKMYKIKQRTSDEKVCDIRATVFEQLDSIGIKNTIKAGDQIAVCCGSRGISNIALIIKSACEYVVSCGAKPFIVPAMGSHGGATDEGQKHVCEKYGVTEEYVGCEIRSCMEPVVLGMTAKNTPVYFDKNAYESDGVIVINRVKPHTDFTGKHESGIIKMLSVGLGKQKGASTMHDNGLRETIPMTAEIILEKAPILAGLGIVENSKDETYLIQGVLPKDFMVEDERLLEVSYNKVPKLPVCDIDVLVVEEMGKQYSGTGMDTKTIGRMIILGEPEPTYPHVNKLVTLRLSNDSYGNALGIGLADITVKKLVDGIDYDAMYANLITTTFLERGKVPVHMPTEKEAIAVGLRTACIVDKPDGRIMIIKNTLHIDEVIVSEAIYQEIKDKVDVIKEDIKITFDEQGLLEV